MIGFKSLDFTKRTVRFKREKVFTVRKKPNTIVRMSKQSYVVMPNGEWRKIAIPAGPQ